MKLSTIKRMDKHNRVVLPREYVKLLGLKEGSEFFIHLDTETKEIKISVI